MILLATLQQLQLATFNLHNPEFRFTTLQVIYTGKVEIFDVPTCEGTSLADEQLHFIDARHVEFFAWIN